MIIRAALLLTVVSTLLAAGAVAHADGLPVTLAVDPTRTFLRTVAGSAADTVPIELASLGIAPGTTIQIDRLGTYRNGQTANFSDNVTGMIGLFSAGATLLPSDAPHRVPGAIDAGFDFPSPATCPGGVPTDIVEDFQISPTFLGGPISSAVVQVPAGATHLFIAAIDCFYGDNDDPNGDFSVRISRADVDRDGVVDDVDACLPSDVRPTVDTGSGPTSVGNVVDAQGCTIQDYVNAIAAAAQTTGDYVRAIVALVQDLADAGLVDGADRGELVSGAARAR